MIRPYDYHCEANGKTLEVEHSWKIVLRTWGELTDLLEIDPGDTPRSAPVSRLIGNTIVVKQQETAEKRQSESPKPKQILHPMGCLCGCMPQLDGGMSAFQQKLLRMVQNNGEKNDS